MNLRKLVLIGLVTLIHNQSLTAQVKVLVGGTLIDGFGGTPIKNSVVIIDGERIKQVGDINTVTIPDVAEIISTEGMSVLAGSLGKPCTFTVEWPCRLWSLATYLSKDLWFRDHALICTSIVDGRHHQRP